ncbi:MAG: hypothetical protein MJ106_06310, partial [Lentisphaeria bacterium]|nr:hypothetical protein [Lentisphaeria bacterium]
MFHAHDFQWANFFSIGFKQRLRAISTTNLNSSRLWKHSHRYPAENEPQLIIRHEPCVGLDPI